MALRMLAGVLVAFGLLAMDCDGSRRRDVVTDMGCYGRYAERSIIFPHASSNVISMETIAGLKESYQHKINSVHFMDKMVQ